MTSSDVCLLFKSSKFIPLKLERKEISVIRRTAYYRALSTSLPVILPNLMVLLVFTTHILTANSFTAPEVIPFYKQNHHFFNHHFISYPLNCITFLTFKVFLTLALVDTIQRTLTGFADGVGRMAEVIASTNRIQVYVSNEQI